MHLGKSNSYAESHVCVADADGSNERVVYSTPHHLEAPNWSPDGVFLLLNSGGQLYRLAVAGDAVLERFDTGTMTSEINNDHGISPDGKRIAISAGPIYVTPAEGGEPQRVISKAPSYFHGWSPDGKTLVYCGQRESVFNLFATPADAVNSITETRLTFGAGHDDGPDYSPDGRWIYFNSNRTGKWRIWRIPAGGSGGKGDPLAQQITTGNDGEDWFPHPSPDGKWIVFLSFPPGTTGHPSGLEVALRRIPMPDSHSYSGPVSNIETIAQFFGGQGTLNVNSWSPDGEMFAYVRYKQRGA